jgi:hypothetical protein
MALTITALNKIKTMPDSELKELAIEVIHLKEVGSYPSNPKVKDLAREITKEFNGVSFNNALDLVKSEVLTVIARKFVS